MTAAPKPIHAACAVLSAKTSIRAGALALICLTSACATQPPEARATGEIFDPYEGTNREIHKVNLAVDRYAFRPASKGYVAIVPPDMVTAFSNFAENLSMPGNAVNYLLQGDLKMAGTATARFMINTVLGVGGFGDAASDFGVAETRTDFGETLHVWGVGEGAYVELPLLGPSNARDATGTFVDFFTNPIGLLDHNPVENIEIYAEIVDRLGQRGTYSDTVDSVLYESADSYAQGRLIYLQNRRFELGQNGATAEIDPFALETEGF